MYILLVSEKYEKDKPYEEDVMKCSICAGDVDVQIGGWDQGHNAYPINDGRCCSHCNDTIVVPRRIREYYAGNISTLDILNQLHPPGEKESQR